jgi:hypothetical protein
MSQSRRATLFAFLGLAVGQCSQLPDSEERRNPRDRDKEEDPKLPNGKSQKDAISKQAHEDALKEIESLIQLAEELRDEVKKSGEFVVAVSSLKKTEEIEKLARRIRGKLKA